MSFQRKFWALLYKLKLYKPKIIDDGVTDNTKAAQAMLDVDGHLILPALNDIKQGGIIYIKKR